MSYMSKSNTQELDDDSKALENRIKSLLKQELFYRNRPTSEKSYHSRMNNILSRVLICQNELILRELKQLNNTLSK